MDNLNDMILLAEVAECGGFTAAGNRLGIPKSTVSQRIASLETRLGLRLLNRSTRHVALTSSGQVYIEYCRRIRIEAASADMAMANLREQPVGSLRITCPEVTASYFMPSFLHGFAAQFPKIDIEVMATNEPLDIIKKQIDFAFRVGSATGQDLIIRKISLIDRRVVASPDYLRVSPPVKHPKDLLQHRGLVHKPHFEWSFSNDGTKETISPPARMKSDSMGLLLQLSLASTGVALLPAYVCASYISAGSLVTLLPKWKAAPYEMVMLFPSLKNLSNTQSAFRSYVNAYDFSRMMTGDTEN